MRDFEKRMIKEADKLAVRVNRINLFMLSERFNNLSEVEREDLKAQYDYMTGYLATLNKRIANIIVD